MRAANVPVGDEAKADGTNERSGPKAAPSIELSSEPRRGYHLTTSDAEIRWTV